MEIQVGSLVISKCGRDKSKYFVVMQIIDDHVYLSDGDIRKVENPKKKKIKHVQATAMFSEHVSKSIKENKTLTNKEVQKEISSYVCKGEI